MPRTPTLFDDMRTNMREAIDLSIVSLCTYFERFRHVVIAYSGGKDSSAVVTLVLYLIEIGAVPRPESLTVLYADTRMELPPLQAAAIGVMDEARRRGYNAEMVLPPLDHRYFVYMLGTGVPPPSNHFRWCTDKLKIVPMLGTWQRRFDEAGEKLLILTGVRQGESAIRDAKIALSCSRDNAECGQGWFQEAAPEALADTLAPLIHWRVCHVWDWLMLNAPDLGFPTEMIAEAYGGDEAAESGARTGCFGCNLVEEDRALENVLSVPRWKYLSPLRRLRPIYREAQQPQNRLVLIGIKRKDGKQAYRNGVPGALRIEHRRRMLAEILEVQDEINSNRGEMPEVSIINVEERERIEELLDAKTLPGGYNGNEITGDVWRAAEAESRRNPAQLSLLPGADVAISPELIEYARALRAAKTEIKEERKKLKRKGRGRAG